MNALSFNLDRAMILVRNDLRTSIRRLLVGLAAAAGAFLAIDTIGYAVGGTGSARDQSFAFLLLVGGYIVTSLAFADIHDPKRATHYLTLPGSILEKYVGRLVLTSIGWTVLAVAFWMATTLVSAGIDAAFFSGQAEVFLPVSQQAWDSIGTYLVSQSIFLFGAVYFRKAQFIKTVLASVLVAFAFAFVSMILLRLAFIGLMEGFFPTESAILGVFYSVPEDANLRFLRALERIGTVLYWLVTPLFFWVLGYRRMRETEV